VKYELPCKTLKCDAKYKLLWSAEEVNSKTHTSSYVLSFLSILRSGVMAFDHPSDMSLHFILF